MTILLIITEYRLFRIFLKTEEVRQVYIESELKLILSERK